MSMKYYDPVVSDESVSAVTATPSVELGARRYVGAEEYVYVYNAGGADVYPKYGVKFITGASGYSIANTALTDVASPFCGVIKHATLTAGSYGWCMTKGFTSVIVNSALTFDYRALALGLGGGFAESVPVTVATHYGTFAVVAQALGVNTGAAGTAYARIFSGA